MKIKIIKDGRFKKGTMVVVINAYGQRLIDEGEAKVVSPWPKKKKLETKVKKDEI